MDQITPGPLERKNLNQQVYDQLERQIISGKLSPGSRLSEGEVAAVFGVSRSPVREAILELERVGFATRVGPRARIVSQPTEEKIRDFFETWWILDVGRTYQSSLMAEKSDHLRLLEVIGELEYAVDAKNEQRISQLTEEFHGILYGSAENRVLDRIAAENRKYLEWLTHLYMDNVEDSSIWRQEHRRIVAAFIDRDLPGLVDTLRSHILPQGEQIIQGLKVAEISQRWI